MSNVIDLEARRRAIERADESVRVPRVPWRYSVLGALAGLALLALSAALWAGLIRLALYGAEWVLAALGGW